MSGSGSALGEFELIERYFARPATRADVILGIGDDAALLRLPAECDLAAAVDTLVAGRHFPEGSNAGSVGHRALAVNLSDLAAMGAVPAWATLALTLPAADARWLADFSAGFGRLAALHGVELVGGDTTAGPLTISVQIMGYVKRGMGLRRSGARPGDVIVVTGTLGDAAAGLALAQGRLNATDAAAAAAVTARFEYPEPRVQFGIAALSIASAAMDVSDGLAGDLPKLAAASGVAARVDVDRLPLSRALGVLATPSQAREWALSGGDDYEILATVAPQRFAELNDAARRLNLTLTAIGEMQSGAGVAWLLEGKNFSTESRGWDHFR